MLWSRRPEEQARASVAAGSIACWKRWHR